MLGANAGEQDLEELNERLLSPINALDNHVCHDQTRLGCRERLKHVIRSILCVDSAGGAGETGVVRFISTGRQENVGVAVKSSMEVRKLRG